MTAAAMKVHEENIAAAKKAWEEIETAAKKAQEEKETTAKKAWEEKVYVIIMKLKEKVTNTTVCRQQYQENYHNGPHEMPIVVSTNDALLGIIGPLREGQFCDTYMLQV